MEWKLHISEQSVKLCCKQNIWHNNARHTKFNMAAIFEDERHEPLWKISSHKNDRRTKQIIFDVVGATKKTHQNPEFVCLRGIAHINTFVQLNKFIILARVPWRTPEDTAAGTKWSYILTDFHPWIERHGKYNKLFL